MSGHPVATHISQHPLALRPYGNCWDTVPQEDWVCGFFGASQLYKMWAPPLQIPSAEHTPCGSLDAECGSSRGAPSKARDTAWLKVMYTATWVSCRLTKSPCGAQAG